MGLDMYIYKFKKPIDLSSQSAISLFKDLNNVEQINDRKLKDFIIDYVYVDEEEEMHLCQRVAYWRKANMVHKFLYDSREDKTLSDYMSIPISINTLGELLGICKEIVYRYSQNNTKGILYAKEKLPTQKGFFFGSIEYDDGYFSDIEITISQIESLLQNMQLDEELFYLADY